MKNISVCIEPEISLLVSWEWLTLGRKRCPLKNKFLNSLFLEHLFLKACTFKFFLCPFETSDHFPYLTGEIKLRRCLSERLTTICWKYKLRKKHYPCLCENWTNTILRTSSQLVDIFPSLGWENNTSQHWQETHRWHHCHHSIYFSPLIFKESMLDEKFFDCLTLVCNFHILNCFPSLQSPRKLQCPPRGAHKCL